LQVPQCFKTEPKEIKSLMQGTFNCEVLLIMIIELRREKIVDSDDPGTNIQISVTLNF
jgi:hypothetical protein